MKQLVKIPSLIQILIAEMLAVMFLFTPVGKVYEKLHPAVGFKSLPFDKADYVFSLIGLLLYLWLLREIFRPRVKGDSWVHMKTGASSGGDYPFLSTHPSYVFIDLMTVGFWLFVRWLWSEGWEERVYQGTIQVALAAVIPALRLLAWYGLRLRPERDGEEVKDAWKPIAG